MKALTVCQPWAWLIIHGPKRWENRSWKTSYRGPLGIHAAGSHERIESVYNLPHLKAVLPDPSELVFSALIGVVNLKGIEPIEDVGDEPFAVGPWCWRMDDPRPLPEPIEMPGRRRLWDVPDGLVEPESL